MERGTVSIFYGEGKGKTAAAIGSAIHAAIQGKTVILIQFLKGRTFEQSAFVQSLEPNIKWFSFEKEDVCYDELTEEKKQEAVINMQNGLKFSKKVLTTKEADLLILDEVLGLVEQGLVSVEEIMDLFDSRWESTDLILTGRRADERLLAAADHVSRIEKVK
ncbi:MAG: cob(I)yrinic acid a,c-diamide adenosyltransferase [Lachnospiraceae bacterium]|nr:cob(I)yrinic acid a,c-diamide adenosyltransferase [Lachnospiraceae bacterium]